MKKLFAATAIFALTATSAFAADVNVFAAASLKGALDEIGAAYKAKSGNGIVATYAASGALAKQIEAAAPADVFISADKKWMDELASKNLIKPDTRHDIAGNTLVVVKQKDAKIDVKADKLAEALGDEKLVIGDPKSVPAGNYAQATLTKLGEWDGLQKNIVLQDNVRSALALVSKGEAKLGIVYGSDVLSDPKTEVAATFADDSHAPIVYPAAVVAASANDGAAGFVEFLQSPEAEAILKKDGFTTLH
ncbi:molybdate ABC transporter substrate-binding protein [Aestuariivirga litoralis]|uniref:molybdate ABC transporter substrate-binding protein n=1 Tax=Aestuariivirga litoralis TaxID=2650924 RepID=UPI0018C55CDD|nr:molybdate ABC transporter substrate-binding protein [Aestuariivirga litoralis]